MTTFATKQSESLHARVPQDILEVVDQLAVTMGRSRNWVLNEALKQYLDVQKWQIELIKQRLAESKNLKAKFVAHDTVMQKYEKHLKAKLAI